MTGILLVIAGALLLNLYAFVLVLLRAPLFKTQLYRPMILNIGLSLTPILVLILTVIGLFIVVTAAPSPLAVWIVTFLGGVIWLALLPNSAYLITELNFSHRKEKDLAPLWYDIVLTLTLSLSGVINALLNVVLAQTLFALIAHPNSEAPLMTSLDSWVFVFVIIVLVTVGIYFGRYIRFNSWDLLHPTSFVHKLRDHFRKRGSLKSLLGFSLLHSILLICLYLFLVAPIVVMLH